MWHIRRFDELSLEELEEIYRLRQTIFILEQESFFADIDGEDREAVHIFHKEDGSITSYCRITTNGKIVIGRVLVNPGHRGGGRGRKLFDHALAYIRREYPSSPIDITAMCYLEDFYESFGFRRISERYDISGHLHVDMALEQ
ncbi:GNAT family N-acetyltransferase [Salinicoccus luteus]|uniref:GNAT family N-acetyltransferase n=1 Tax=Salinicoccus luteus TaxID=367840 RepID=UPI0004E15D96|nr:GNAT family N-acetyltransferase [Salinicoccus luteus]